MKGKSKIPTHQPHVYRNRLLRLAALIEKNEGRFNWSHWVGEDYQGKPDLSCGTTACALGWATTMPELRREGLCLKPCPVVGTRRPFPFNHKLGSSSVILIGITHFGLTGEECSVLFFPGHTGDHIAIAGQEGLYERFTGDEKDGKGYANWLRYFVKRKDFLVSNGHSAQWGAFKPQR